MPILDHRPRGKRSGHVDATLSYNKCRSSRAGGGDLNALGSGCLAPSSPHSCHYSQPNLWAFFLPAVERVSWYACAVMLALWYSSAGVLVHEGIIGVREVPMVEVVVSAGRCTPVPRGFGFVSVSCLRGFWCMYWNRPTMDFNSTAWQR